MNTHKHNQQRKALLRTGRSGSARAVLLSKPFLTSAAILAALPLAMRADDDCCAKPRDTDSFSFSARMGFNISTRFKNPGRIVLTRSTRKTPDGLTFNYEDGYVLTDVSGDAGGYTSNWGFDHAGQVTPPATPDNHLALSRTTAAQGISSPWESADPSMGGEVVYRHEFGTISKKHDWRWGFEAAANFGNFSLNDHKPYGGNVTRQTDTYVPYPGTEITDPRQGTFNGPGQLLNDTPISTTFSSAAAIISGVRKIDADMFGCRLGPYFELPVSTNLNLSLSGGFAAALLDVNVSWNETLSVGTAQYPFAGRGHDNELRMGAYLAATADYRFAEDWSLVGSVQYQTLANYERAIAGRTVDIDLSHTIFVTLGVNYHF